MIDLLAVLLVALVPVNLAVAWKLHGLQRAHPGIRTLRERADTAKVLSVGASLAGFMGLVALQVIEVDRVTTITVLACLALVVSAPNLLWGALLVTGRFRDGAK